MKKRLIGLMLAAAMALTLAACGKDNGDSDQESAGKDYDAASGELDAGQESGAESASVGMHHVEITVRDYR